MPVVDIEEAAADEFSLDHPAQGGSGTKVTYFIWHPNMVALGAISSKLSLTSRDNPVRCVRGDMLSDFDS